MKYFKKGNTISVFQDDELRSAGNINLMQEAPYAVRDFQKIQFKRTSVSYKDFTEFILEDGTRKSKTDLPTFESFEVYALKDFFFVAKPTNGQAGIPYTFTNPLSVNSSNNVAIKVDSNHFDTDTLLGLKIKQSIIDSINNKADKSTTYTKTETNELVSKKQTIFGSYAEFTINEKSSVLSNDVLSLTKVEGSDDIPLDGNYISLPANKSFEIHTNLNTGSYTSKQRATISYKRLDDYYANIESIGLSDISPNASKTNLYTTDADTVETENFSKKINLILQNSSVSGWKETLLSSANIDYVGISAIEISKDNNTIAVVDYTPKYPSEIYVYNIVNNQFEEIFKAQRQGGGSCCLNQDGTKLFIGDRYSSRVILYEKNINTNQYQEISTITGTGSLGQSIACSDDGLTLIASAHSINAVFVYKYDNVTSQYTQYAKITLNNTNLLGYSLSCSSDATWIALTDNNGSVRIVKHEPSTEMKYQEKFQAPNTGYDTCFNSAGNILTYSTASAIVGNITGNRVYVFKRGVSDIDWVKMQEITFPIETHNGFGYSLDFSADGTTLAVATKYLIENGASKSGVMYVFKSNDQWQTYTQESIYPQNIPQNGVVGHSCAISSDGNFIVEGGAKVRGYQRQSSIDNLDISILQGSKILIKETAKDDKVSNTTLNDRFENFYNKSQINDTLELINGVYYSGETIKNLYTNAEDPYEATPIQLNVNGLPIITNNTYALQAPLPYTEFFARPFIKAVSINLKGATNLTSEFIVFLPNYNDINTIFYDDEKELNVLSLIKNTNTFKVIDPIKYPTDIDKMNWYFDKDTISFNIEPLAGAKKIIFRVVGLNLKIGNQNLSQTPPIGDDVSNVEIKFRWSATAKTWETTEIN